MMVARHEMPGNAAPRNPSRRARCDRVGKGLLASCTINKTWRHESYRSLRDGSFLDASQAFHAWLPSSSPSGTKAHSIELDHSDQCLGDRCGHSFQPAGAFFSVGWTRIAHDPGWRDIASQPRKVSRSTLRCQGLWIIGPGDVVNRVTIRVHQFRTSG